MFTGMLLQYLTLKSSAIILSESSSSGFSTSVNGSILHSDSEAKTLGISSHFFFYYQTFNLSKLFYNLNIYFYHEHEGTVL